DGLRCVGSPLVRLYVVQPNVDPLDTPSSPSIVVQGGITTPGTVKGYFLAYRDPAAYACPPPATYNASHALNVTGAPYGRSRRRARAIYRAGREAWTSRPADAVLLEEPPHEAPHDPLPAPRRLRVVAGAGGC